MRVVQTILSITALLALSAGHALAGWAIGNVTYLNAKEVNGRAVAQVAVANHQVPCPGGNGFAFVIDTPVGRAQYATLLAAWHAGTWVGISGGEQCGLILPGAENVSHVDVATGCCGR